VFGHRGLSRLIGESACINKALVVLEQRVAK